MVLLEHFVIINPFSNRRNVLMIYTPTESCGIAVRLVETGFHSQHMALVERYQPLFPANNMPRWPDP